MPLNSKSFSHISNLVTGIWFLKAFDHSATLIGFTFLKTEDMLLPKRYSLLKKFKLSMHK